MEAAYGACWIAHVPSGVHMTYVVAFIATIVFLMAVMANPAVLIGSAFAWWCLRD